jgi:membrane protein required for colicin V production
LSTADIILIVFLIIGGYSGYKKGLILEIIAILAFILAIIGGFKLLHLGMDIIASFYDGFGNLLPFMAFMLIFVAVIIVVSIVGRIVKKIIDWTPLGSVDNVAGAVLGVFKWALILSILMWMFNSIGISLPSSMMHNSSLYPVIAGVAPKVFEWITVVFPSFELFIDSVTDFFESLRN